MTIERARELRRSMSAAEARMWNLLRTAPFKALHFRRQFAIGPYYADFASFKARLVIEVDGSQHYEDAAIAYDARLGPRSAGRSSQVRLSRTRPVRFLLTPPHCLK